MGDYFPDSSLFMIEYNFNRDIHIIVRRLSDLDTQNVDQAININRDLMLLEGMGFVLPLLRRFLPKLVHNKIERQAS